MCYVQERLRNLEQSLLEILEKVVSRLKIIKFWFGVIYENYILILYFRKL